MDNHRINPRRLAVRSTVFILCSTIGLGGCGVIGHSSDPRGPSAGPITEDQAAADARAAIAAVRGLPGVVSTNLSFSPARFGYPSTIYGTIHVTPDAEPVDVLDRAIFQLYRDARVDSYQVMTERDGMLWDTENLGLSRSEDYSGLVDRYGQVTPGQSFPTPPPPRSAPTSRPVPDSTDFGGADGRRRRGRDCCCPSHPWRGVHGAGLLTREVRLLLVHSRHH